MIYDETARCDSTTHAPAFAIWPASWTNNVLMSCSMSMTQQKAIKARTQNSQRKSFHLESHHF